MFPRLAAFKSPVSHSDGAWRQSYSCSSLHRRCAFMSEGGLADTRQEPDEVDSRPRPKIGDVVRYEGKWKEELNVGEVRNLQWIEGRQQWIADVLPLKEIGENEYRRERGARSMVQDVSELRPMRAFYVRSANAFKVMTNKANEVLYVSTGYDLEGFKLPEVEINLEQLAVDLQEYEDLKTRLLQDTLLFGGFGAACAGLVLGLEEGLVFGLGALGSALYVTRLGAAADSVGTEKKVGAEKKGPLQMLTENARFGVPVALVGVLAAANFIRHPESVSFLQLVPKEQFGAAMLGFLSSYRLPLLYREVTGSLAPGELMELVPGSLGQGRKLLTDLRNEDDATVAAAVAGRASSKLSPILVVSGPAGLGAEQLVDNLKQETAGLKSPVWCTDRPAKGTEEDGREFFFLEPIKFDTMKARGEFLVCKEEDGVQYGLKPQDVVNSSQPGQPSVIAADTELARKLFQLDGITTVGVWVSLNSLAAIQERLRSNMAAAGVPADEVDGLLRGQTKKVIDDIEFGVTSGAFDFTVINEDDAVSMEKMRRALGNALRV
ncbi:unnamed protein product [Chrysoparadoxa australica]